MSLGAAKHHRARHDRRQASAALLDDGILPPQAQAEAWRRHLAAIRREEPIDYRSGVMMASASSPRMKRITMSPAPPPDSEFLFRFLAAVKASRRQTREAEALMMETPL